MMNEWYGAIQLMIDWMEAHMCETPTLLKMAEQIGYSPYYCSSQFHAIMGRTLKQYMAARRLARATLEVRDTHTRLLDIALKYGYSSQEAFTRAFVKAFGITPAVYRKAPKAIPLCAEHGVLPPKVYQRGVDQMSETCLKNPDVRMEYIPAHKYIGIWESRATDYMSFWQYHNCDEVTGIVESMSHVCDPIITAHTAGWFLEEGRRGYFYGFGVPIDYEGEVPEGFEIRTIPASYYMVFFHPSFDFMKDNCEVVARVEALAWHYDIKAKGYEWNEAVCPDYQRHQVETIGYEVLRPIKKMSSVSEKK